MFDWAAVTGGGAAKCSIKFKMTFFLFRCVEDPLADVLKQRYRTVREQLAALKKRKALLESKGVPVPPPCPKTPSSTLTPMILSAAQKLQLQQQIQQVRLRPLLSDTVSSNTINSIQ